MADKAGDANGTTQPAGDYLNLKVKSQVFLSI